MLKVGDMIEAIDACRMDYIVGKETLTIGKLYKVEAIADDFDECFTITDDDGHGHWFSTPDNYNKEEEPFSKFFKVPDQHTLLGG